jgi:hypothetical protein
MTGKGRIFAKTNQPEADRPHASDRVRMCQGIQRRGTTPIDPWLKGLLERKHPNQAAVAQANRNARIAWALLARNRAYPCVHFKDLQHGLPTRPVCVPGSLAWWRGSLNYGPPQ